MRKVAARLQRADNGRKNRWRNMWAKCSSFLVIVDCWPRLAKACFFELEKPCAARKAGDSYGTSTPDFPVISRIFGRFLTVYSRAPAFAVQRISIRAPDVHCSITCKNRHTYIQARIIVSFIVRCERFTRKCSLFHRKPQGLNADSGPGSSGFSFRFPHGQVEASTLSGNVPPRTKAESRKGRYAFTMIHLAIDPSYNDAIASDNPDTPTSSIPSGTFFGALALGTIAFLKPCFKAS